MDNGTSALPFVDLAAQRARLRDQLDAAIRRVLDHGQFIMGPEVNELESRLAERCGVRHVVTCSSGTDALVMSLMVSRVGPGDAVFVPAFTFPATPEAVALLGARPVFVDVERGTCTIDPTSLVDAVEQARCLGLRPAAVIAVDLYGQPADYDSIKKVCGEEGVVLIADAAQSIGGQWQGRPVGSLADITATSFFPAKPLGCFGDGGALLTDDHEAAAAARSIRVHGVGADKYDIVRIGLNARLDTVQAAVLLVKLTVFDDELTARERVADRYQAGLDGLRWSSFVRPEARSAWASYTVGLERRDLVAARLAARRIPTAVYYPRPLHRQPAYRTAPTPAGGLAVAEQIATEVLSLPMHPYLSAEDQRRVIAEVNAAVAES